MNLKIYCAIYYFLIWSMHRSLFAGSAYKPHIAFLRIAFRSHSSLFASSALFEPLKLYLHTTIYRSFIIKLQCKFNDKIATIIIRMQQAKTWNHGRYVNAVFVWVHGWGELVWGVGQGRSVSLQGNAVTQARRSAPRTPAPPWGAQCGEPHKV